MKSLKLFIEGLIRFDLAMTGKTFFITGAACILMQFNKISFGRHYR